MSFNEILARERKSRGLSQEELASMLQVSRQAVSKWETGDAMPDLPKLLALADALNISLDALCGREPPPAPAAPSDAPLKTSRVLLPVILCIFLLLAAALVLLLSMARPGLPTVTTDLSTMGEFTVSGVNFHGRSGTLVSYQFSPGISGEGLSYQITFADAWGNAYSFDAPCSDGVCYGEATLDGGYLGYAVTVCVTDGVLSRSLAIANDLNFSQDHASWTPLVSA